MQQSRSQSPPQALQQPGPRDSLVSRSAVRRAGLLVATAAALGTWLVWWAMVTTWPGQRVEERVFETADRFQDVVNAQVEPLLLLGSLPWLVVGFVLVCGTGLLRGSWGAAGLAAVVILGSNLTTQLVKDGLFYRVGLVGEWNSDVNTLPSGHVTVVAAAWAALLLVVPHRWRPMTALAGAAATCAVGLATLADRWHRPSDVVAAVLVVVAWTALACAVAPGRWSGRSADRSVDRAVGTRLVTGTLWLAAVPAAGLSVLAAVATERTRAGTGLPGLPDLPADGGLTAYVGGLLAACAVAAAAFAVLLPLCQAAARAGTSGRDA